MDRGDLIRLMAEYDDGDLKVDVEGWVWHEDYGGEDTQTKADDIEAALTELESDIAGLRRLIAWAKLAPKYQPPPVATRDENGKQCDEHGSPL